MSDVACLRSIPWETRNLGIESFTITDEFLASPDKERLSDSISRVSGTSASFFIQVRVGKNNLAALPMLQQQGFYFVETALVPHSILKKNELLARFVDSRSDFVPARIDASQLELVLLDKHDEAQCDEVRGIARESFSDDRFHLDANCSAAIADRRFSYWVDDLLADDAVVFYLLIYASNPIGFMARKDANLILAGFAKKYVNSGLGDFLWLSVLEDMKRQGIHQTHTMISANNTSVMNLYARLGFKFKNPAVTLHYWSSPAT